MNVVIGAIFSLSLLITSSNSDENVGQASNAFALAMYQGMKDASAENVFFSPLSVHTILSVLFLGSAGKTEKEFISGLHFGNMTTDVVKKEYHQLLSELRNPSPDVITDIANKIFLAEDYKVKKEFLSAAISSFFCEVQNLDFAMPDKAVETINDWVEDKTHKKIKDLLQEGDVNSGTTSVMVNAIYFKGTWQTKFKKDDTRKENFNGKKGNKMVDMMHVTSGFNYAYDTTLGAQILEMPYNGTPGISMVIVLPIENSPNAIENVEKNMKSFYYNENEFDSTTVHVSLPKFKLETTIDLKQHLQQMGFKSMFSPDANFSNLSEESVYVSKVIQKAYVEVNEEGSEAAAATAVIMNEMGAVDGGMPKEIYFIADHPFIFIIQETSSKTAMFIGKVNAL